MKHWKVETKEDDDLKILTLDVAGRSANVLTMEVMRELEEIIDKIDAAGHYDVIIRSGKQNGFIFGADVEEFKNVETAKEAEALAKYGQSVFQKIADLPFSTVAMINGACLGGGLELALACKYRVAQDDAKLGLPEILLGIHPGFGGTVRLPKLIGDAAALQIMLTGKSVDAKKAKRLELVDEVVPERHLLNAALALIEKNPERKKLSLKKRFAGLPLIRKFTANQARKKIAEKADPRHYPAPYRVIDLWENKADFDQEARSLGEMLVSETSKNIVYLFLKKEELKREAKKNPHNVKYVHIVGAGKMGRDIAMWCAANGFTVSLTDQSTPALGEAMKKSAEFFKKKLKDPRKIREAADRLILDPTGDCAKKADLVIEAIVENAGAKQNLFKKLEQIVPPDAILATNTSSIPLEIIGEKLNDPSRLVGLHFFNPATRMEVVEVIKGKNTAPSVLGRVKAFTAAIDKIPITVKSESPGFLINRCLIPYLLEGVKILAERYSKEDIDKSAVSFGMPMGPIELADMIGLDVCLLVAKELSGRMDIEVPMILREMVAEGKLGKANGKGFYNYKNGKISRSETKSEGAAIFTVTNRLYEKFTQEAICCLNNNVVETDDEINVALVFGTGFAPFRGGPLPLK